MPVLDTLSQLYLLHEPASYARMTRPGARCTNYMVYCTPPCPTHTAQQRACVTNGEAPYGRCASVRGQIMESVTASCHLAAVPTQAARAMGLPRMQEVPA